MMGVLALAFATATTAASLPPSNPRLEHRRRASAMSISLDEANEFQVVDDPTIVRALTDPSIAGDNAPPWATALRAGLAASLRRHHLEPGIDHPEEETVQETLEDHKDDGAAFLSSIILSSSEPWRGDLLRLIARAPTNLTQPWGMALAQALLCDPDVDVREASICALETWGGERARELLGAHVDPEAWLTEYAHRVASEL